MRPEQAGLASGLVNTTAQVGGALGLAVLATLSTTRSTALAASGHSAVGALIGGYHLAFWIATGLIVAAVAIGAALLTRSVPAVAAEPAEVRGEHAIERTGVAAESVA